MDEAVYTKKCMRTTSRRVYTWLTKTASAVDGLLCAIGQRKKILFPRGIRGRGGGSRSTICLKRREEEILVDENPTVPLLRIV